MDPFSISCTTCQAKLRVRSQEVIGKILACPKCHSMVQVLPPAGWTEEEAEVVDSETGTATDEAGPVEVPAFLPRASEAERSLQRHVLGGTASIVGLALIAGLLAYGFARRRSALKSPDDRIVIAARAQPSEDGATRGQAIEAPPRGASESSQAEQSDHVVVGRGLESKDSSASVDRNSLEASSRAATADGDILAPAGAPHAESTVGRPSDDDRPDGGNRVLESATKQSVTKDVASKGSERPQQIDPNNAVEQPAGQVRPDVSRRSSRGVRPSDVSQQVDVEARLADKLRQIDFPATPLSQLIDFLMELSGVPITLDLEALNRANMHPTEKVTIHGQDTTVAHVLSSVLEPHGLTYVVEDRGLLITASGPQWRRVRYRVGDLAGPPREGDQSGALERFALLLRQLIAPDSWERVGGRGKMTARESALHIEQSSAVHQQILRFCERLRSARGLPLRSRLAAERFSLSSKRARLRNQLGQPVTFTFVEPTPLVDIVAYLQRISELTIVVDWRGLAADTFTPSSEISCAVVDQQLHAGLSTILQPLGLDWRAVDADVLQIVTRANADNQMDLEFYDVRHRLGPDGDGDGDRLADQLRQATGDKRWSDRGGQGRVIYDKASAHLIVRQSQAIQEQVERWLESTAE